MLRYLMQHPWLLPLRAAICVVFGLAMLVLWGTIDSRTELETLILSLFSLVTFAVFLVLSGGLLIQTAIGIQRSALRFALTSYAVGLIGVAAVSLSVKGFDLRWMATLTAAQAGSFALLDGLLADALTHHSKLFRISALSSTISLAWFVALLVVRDSEASMIVGAIGSYSVSYGLLLIVFSSALRKRREIARAHAAAASMR